VTVDAGKRRLMVASLRYLDTFVKTDGAWLFRSGCCTSTGWTNAHCHDADWAQKRLVIVGATGMVGSCALRYALDHPAVGRVTAIGRKPAGVTHRN